MSAIELVLSRLLWNPSTSASDARSTTAVEVKAALVSLVEPFDLRAGSVVRPAAIVDPTLDAPDAFYGPRIRLRLDDRFSALYARIDEHVQSVTGYTLAELSTADAIERAMLLCGSSDDRLYSALMKLWRLEASS